MPETGEEVATIQPTRSPEPPDQQITQRLADDGPTEQSAPAGRQPTASRPAAQPAHGSAATAPEQAAGPANAAGAQKIQMPDSPSLAPGVRLAGQIQESAFENPPWLIEREGAGYVQVTELLYRIAEQCDGQHTLEQIAEAVSEATGRSVSADNVRQLVGTQLVAKGMVPAADGRVVGAGAGSRSLLAMSLKAKMIGPDILRPFTRPLQLLFWPPVFTVVLILAMVALGWVFFVHGVAAGARQLLYAPTLMILALTVTALGAGFHELGHAAALSYAGGKPRGMGVGLYLVYPAFYTDVSDNYKLTRWARVRTDLGGIFFHLVFMIGLVGVYALTGWEPLLIFVVLLMLDALHQLMPLVRLDGYWTLADITGVPDFYSYMGAFVRRFLPGKENDSAASRLPTLKWWGTLVFALYVLVAIPMMLFTIFMMLRSAPTILATGWDSAHQQWGALHEAASGGNPFAVGFSALQLVVLILPAAALIYSLVRFGRRIGGAVWNWSKPTPQRRVIGGLGTVAALAFLVYLWAPSLPFTGGRSGPLYNPTVSSFTPIRTEDRGTFFDAVGAEQPSWIAAPAPGAIERPAASPEPAIGAEGAAASPAPLIPGEAATPDATPETPATPAPTVVPTAPSQPTIAPAAPTAPAKPNVAPAAPTVAAPASAPQAAPTPATGPAAQPAAAPTQRPLSTPAASPTLFRP